MILARRLEKQIIVRYTRIGGGDPDFLRVQVDSEKLYPHARGWSLGKSAVGLPAGYARTHGGDPADYVDSFSKSLL